MLRWPRRTLFWRPLLDHQTRVTTLVLRSSLDDPHSTDNHSYNSNQYPRVVWWHLTLNLQPKYRIEYQRPALNEGGDLHWQPSPLYSVKSNSSEGCQKVSFLATIYAQVISSRITWWWHCECHRTVHLTAPSWVDTVDSKLIDIVLFQSLKQKWLLYQW